MYLLITESEQGDILKSNWQSHPTTIEHQISQANIQSQTRSTLAAIAHFIENTRIAPKYTPNNTPQKKPKKNMKTKEGKTIEQQHTSNIFQLTFTPPKIA